MEKMNMEISKPDKSRIDVLFTGNCSKTMLGFDYLRLNNKRKASKCDFTQKLCLNLDSFPLVWLNCW
jgi:hypothetical protein